MTIETYDLNLAEDEDKWITINSNGDGSGSHVKIDENGNVIAGMGGKFNGKNIKETGTGGEGEKTSRTASITASEKSSLATYSGDHFLDINSRLRNDGKTDAEIQRIDSAISKSTIPAQTLYRGMSRDAAKKLFPGGEIKAGSIISDKAFSSTSTKKSIAKMNSIGGVMLQIDSPEGATGIDMGDISSNKQESEVLLPRNAKMQVVGTIPPKNAGDPVVVKVRYISGDKMAKDSVQSVLAFDRASVRTFDQDGLLHVSMTPISKANVCTYYGREIPESESLGLDAATPYKMLRCPEELKKAAPTFNKKPVLNTHLPVFASAPPKDAIIGSTGEGANFDGVMLNNSMVVWDDKSIAGIESNQQREISSSYRYRADMTPGVYNGEEYDGVMRDIVCNHVAIVPDGRAGPDVLVYDSKPIGYDIMSKFNKLWAFVKPRLASDANPDEVEKEVKKIVEDEDKDDDKEKDKEKDKMARDNDPDETEEERVARIAKERDERIKESEEKERRMASDSKAIEQRLRDQLQGEYRALRQAERDCAPFVGNMACDSAEELYRATLNHAGVKGVDTLPSAALKPMVDMLKTSRTMANDAAPTVTADSMSRVNNFFEGK